MMNQKRNLRTGQSVWEGRKSVPVKTGRTPTERYYDVAVIGCGITGALSCNALAKAGLTVLALDRRTPAAGSTSASTALIQWEVDQPLSVLVKKVGPAKAKQAYKACHAAVHELQTLIERSKFNCDMRPRDTLLIAGDTMDAKALQKETALRTRAGLPSKFLNQKTLKAEYGFDREGAILSSGNIELDPRKLTRDILAATQKHDVEIVSPANVVKLEAAEAGVFLTLENGQTIACGKVVVATGYEVLPEIPQSRFDLISTWAVATKPQQPKALWPRRCLVWEASDPYLYFRTTADNRIIVGGEDAQPTCPPNGATGRSRRNQRAS